MFVGCLARCVCPRFWETSAKLYNGAMLVVVRYLKFQLCAYLESKAACVWQQRCGDVYRVGVALVSFCSVVGSTVAWVRWEEILYNCLHNSLSRPC